MRAAFVLKDRSDPELLAGVCAAIAREKEDVALVIAHLAEMETRKLFAGEGFRSPGAAKRRSTTSSCAAEPIMGTRESCSSGKY